MIVVLKVTDGWTNGSQIDETWTLLLLDFFSVSYERCARRVVNIGVSLKLTILIRHAGWRVVG